MIGAETVVDGPHHDRLYRGWRVKDGCRLVVVDGPLVNRELDVSGLDWGAGGAGTERLARLLLEDAIATPEARERALPERLSAAFAAEVLMTLPRQDPWIIWRLDILDWAHEQLEVIRG